MNPEIWGPKFWDLLFDVAFHYDYIERDVSKWHRNALKTFFRSVSWVLPCSHCREKYAEWYSRDTPEHSQYFQWLYNLRNKVNKRLKRRDPPPTLEIVKIRHIAWINGASCPCDIWFILYSIASNRFNRDHDATERQYHLFLVSLIGVLELIPRYSSCVDALKTQYSKVNRLDKPKFLQFVKECYGPGESEKFVQLMKRICAADTRNRDPSTKYRG